MSLRFLRSMAAVTAMVVLGSAGVSAKTDNENVGAFAVWAGEGTMQKTGADQATFTGTLAGHLYIETEEGPIVAGVVMCPMTLQISTADKSEHGDGKCTLTQNSRGEIYGEWRCAGFFLVGCLGDFKFTGGTGQFNGIAGGGKLTIRANSGGVFAGGNDSAAAKGGGIMFWRNLRYTIP